MSVPQFQLGNKVLFALSSMELINWSCSLGASVSALQESLLTTGADTYSLEIANPVWAYITCML